MQSLQLPSRTSLHFFKPVLNRTGGIYDFESLLTATIDVQHSNQNSRIVKFLNVYRSLTVRNTWLEHTWRLELQLHVIIGNVFCPLIWKPVPCPSSRTHGREAGPLSLTILTSNFSPLQMTPSSPDLDWCPQRAKCWPPLDCCNWHKCDGQLSHKTFPGPHYC